VRETALRQEFGLSTEDTYPLASIAVDFRVAGAVMVWQFRYPVSF
jgi:acetamidase/formamidase